jgi:hypothetical protein
MKGGGEDLSSQPHRLILEMRLWPAPISLQPFLTCSFKLGGQRGTRVERLEFCPPAFRIKSGHDLSKC